MGREVRRVPADWEHPTYGNGRYVPLYEDYETAYKNFMEKVEKDGLQEALEWFGSAPNKNDYMPTWNEEVKTHYMMYETTSEGTPISPAFETPEELAQWLADTGASSFASFTATYEQWLSVAKGRSAPSMVLDNGVMKSGVEAVSDLGGEV